MEFCPCGSQKAYADCCQPLIKGERTADTAEALMRSRYTAHAKKEFDYIFETTHSSGRQDGDRKGTAAWSRKLEWQRLEIRNTEKGGPDDSTGDGWSFWPAIARTARPSITMKLRSSFVKTAAGSSRTDRRRSRFRPSARAPK